MKTYDHALIESKWQQKWAETKLYETPDSVTGKENEYLLVEFPYPSGNLHIGHWYAFAVPDIYARYQRMNGKNVLYPIGFDAFGLPAENAAIKRGLDPRKWTHDNIDFMTEQLKSMGNSFDWSRKVVTCEPEYYRWTQWLFGKLYEKGLAYKKDGTVPWCDSCKTVLANEQIVSGACERCGTAVVQKELAQWYFKITDYADRLLADLDALDWPEEIKQAQREWIGKSEGALLGFAISAAGSDMSDAVDRKTVQVFTTRPDTLFGVTYVVLAPEHSLVTELKNVISNWDEVLAYIEATKAKKELERKEGKEKTGVELKGVKAVNPANGEEVPVWIADYVLASYGTGAVMAVPAHDERDFEFAKKYGLPLRSVVAPPTDNINAVASFLETSGGSHLFQKRTGDAPTNPGALTIFGGQREKDEHAHDCLLRELREELELDVANHEVRYLGCFASGHQPDKKNQIYLVQNVNEVGLVLHEGESIVSLSLGEVKEFEHKSPFLERALRLVREGPECAYPGQGVLANSGSFTGMNSEEAKIKITEHAGGTMTTQYRLRDWLLSRQRYWGTPIPIVYDPEGGAHLVPKEHLPWTLPNDVDFTPTGEAPLAKSKELRERTERIFGKGWTPEVDTMDTFVCSSWYFLRYLDPHNDNEFSPIEKQKAWMPVDRYSGGAEHTTMHLLYSRFFYKALFDLGLVTHAEPYTKRMSRGLILGPDGQKMSKSKGNVIDPDEHVARVGADTVKTYLAFIGPYNEVGQYPWDLGGIAGVRRFLERVWNLRERVVAGGGDLNDASSTTTLSHEAVILLHRTIKKVGEDIRAFKFNTAISQMMILVNAFEKENTVPAYAYESLLLILAPFAPHLAEELWESLGYSTSIHGETWPVCDENVLAQAHVTIVVQVNGKVRGSFRVEQGVDSATLSMMARALPRVAEHLEGVEQVKEVVVPGRLINFVV